MMKKTMWRMAALLLVCTLCIGAVGCGKGPAQSDPDQASSGPSTPSGGVSGDPSPSTTEDSGDLLTPTKDDRTSATKATSSAATTKYNDGKKDDTSYIKPAGSKQAQLFGDLRGTKLYISESDNWFTQNLMKQFKEKYGVEVINYAYSFAEEQSKLPTIVQTGDKKNYIDVVTMSSTVALRYIYNGLVMPMDDYLDKTDSAWNMRGSTVKRFAPYVIGGKTYGSASNSFMEDGLFYNKTYMEEIGLTGDKDPYNLYKAGNWTFKTFLDTAKACKKMSANGKSVKTYGFASWNYFAFCQTAGNSVIEQKKDGTWAVTVDRPEGMAGLDVIYELYQAGTWGNCTAADFAQRKVAMFVGLPCNVMGAIGGYEVMSDEVGYVPLPKKDKNSPQYVVVCPDGRAIASCSQNPRAAAAWIYEFQRAEQVRDESSYGIGNRRQMLSDEHLKIRNDYVKNGTMLWTMVDGLSNWQTENRGKFLDAIIKDGKTPAAAIDQMLPLLEDSLRQTVG